jgi:HEAT repeat protein
MSESRKSKTDLRGADAGVLRILALQSGDPQRIRGAIEEIDSIPPELTPHLIALLGTTPVALDVMRALRAIAASRTGALVDALLDVRLSGVARRRVARIMPVCRTADAVYGLLQACDDEDASIRRQCVRTLFLVRRRHPEIALSEDRVFALIDRELESGAPDAGLVFTLLALVFPPAAIRAAYRSLRGSNAYARGFAREYLNGVLPGDLRVRLEPIVTGLGGDVTSR